MQWRAGTLLYAIRILQGHDVGVLALNVVCAVLDSGVCLFFGLYGIALVALTEHLDDMRFSETFWILLDTCH